MNQAAQQGGLGPSKPIPPAKLYAKLAKVAKAIEKVGKHGFNDAQNYPYAQAADIYAEVRKHLAAEGVLLLPSLAGDPELIPTEKVDRDTGEVKPGLPLTRARYSMLFVDAESGESLTREWMGEGSDFGDKALNKAATAALKTFLINSFQIPTVGDDAEGDASTDQATAGQQPAQRARSNGGALASEKQAKMLWAVAEGQRGRKLKPDEAKAILLKSIGVAEYEKVPRALVDQAKKALAGDPIPTGLSDVPADDVSPSEDPDNADDATVPFS